MKFPALFVATLVACCCLLGLASNSAVACDTHDTVASVSIVEQTTVPVVTTTTTYETATYTSYSYTSGFYGQYGTFRESFKHRPVRTVIKTSLAAPVVAVVAARNVVGKTLKGTSRLLGLR